MKIFIFTCILIKIFCEIKALQETCFKLLLGKNAVIFGGKKNIAFHCPLLGLSYINSPQIIDEIS